MVLILGWIQEYNQWCGEKERGRMDVSVCVDEGNWKPKI